MLVGISNNNNVLMSTLSLVQKNTLVHVIAEDSGLSLDYYVYFKYCWECLRIFSASKSTSQKLACSMKCGKCVAC